MLKITVNMLQNPRVICNGKEISFPVRRADALLYYMVCQKTATRKELVSLLWDSCDNETGHKNLRNTLYALKKSFGQDVLISPRKTTIQFHPEVEIDCDYARFMEQEDYASYQGSFLQGFSLKNAILFEEWVERMREKTREQYLRYLLRLAHEAAERGEIKQAEQYALEYMNHDPLDEQTAVFLMQLYRNNKMYPKVTRVYQKLRECLEEELGIAPLAETTALYYEVMNEWNDTATDDDGIAAGDYLPPLTYEDVRAMLQIKLGSELPAQVVQRIHDETGGNPSLLYELMSGVTDHSSVETLLLQSRHLLDRRLIGLSVSARQLLDIIALFPGSAPCSMLASIYSKGADELLAASEELKRRSLVVEQQMEQGESALTIAYTRLRDMIYQQQSYFKRRPLHLRIARLLAQQAEELDIGLCERLSYHFTQANDGINALVYDSARFLMLTELHCGLLPVLPAHKDDLDDAAPTTDELRELEARVTALQHKLDKNDQLAEAEHKLLLSKALMAFSRGESGSAIAALQQLQDQLTPDEDRHKLIFVCRLLALYHKSMYNLEQMDVYLSLGANLADKSGDELASTFFCLLRGERHSLAGKYDESNYFLSEALDRFKRLRDASRYRLQMAGVYHALGLNEQRQGDISAACAYYKQALAELAGCEPYKGVARIYADYGRAALAIGDHSKARGLLQTALTLGEKTADLPAMAVAGAYMALFSADDYEAAAHFLAQARKTATQAATPLEQGIVYCVIAQLRQKLDMEKQQGNAVDKLLNRPLDVYCRKGLRFLEKAGGAYEREVLAACLRYSNTKSRPFTVPELYSKNKQFMTE